MVFYLYFLFVKGFPGIVGESGADGPPGPMVSPVPEPLCGIFFFLKYRNMVTSSWNKRIQTIADENREV